MNKDQIKGRVNEVSGKIQKNVADKTGNTESKIEGTEKEIAGKIQKNVGDAKNKVADAIDK